MIDPKWIGHQLPSASFDLERGRMKFFATVIGAGDPIYHDEVAARAAGHPDLPALPTFFFSAELDTDSLSTMLALLEVDPGSVLHGEQSFAYYAAAYAGDRLTISSRIADIYEKKGGALEFIVKETQVKNQRGEPVADMRSVIIVRH